MKQQQLWYWTHNIPHWPPHTLCSLLSVKRYGSVDPVQGSTLSLSQLAGHDSSPTRATLSALDRLETFHLISSGENFRYCRTNYASFAALIVLQRGLAPLLERFLSPASDSLGAG